MRFNDAAVGAVLAALSLYVAVEAWDFPSPPGQQFGAWFFPLVLAVALGVASLALMVRGVRADPFVLAVRPPWTRSPGAIVNVLLLPALLIGYVLVVDVIGFVPTAIVLVSVLSMRLGTKPLPALLLATVAAFAIAQVFGGLLRVPLPSTTLGGVTF